MPDADDPMVTMPIPASPPPPPPPPAPTDGHLCGDTHDEEAETGRAFLARKREDTLAEMRHRIAHHSPPNDHVVHAHEDVRRWTFAYGRAMVDLVPASPELDCAVDTLIDTVMHLCNAAVARRPRAVKPRADRLGPIDHVVLSDPTLGLDEAATSMLGLGVPLADGGALDLAGFIKHGAHRCADGGQRAGGSDTCEICVAAMERDMARMATDAAMDEALAGPPPVPGFHSGVSRPTNASESVATDMHIHGTGVIQCMATHAAGCDDHDLATGPPRPWHTHHDRIRVGAPGHTHTNGDAPHTHLPSEAIVGNKPEPGPYVVQWDGTGLAVEAINASVAALGGYIEAQVDDRPGTPEDFLNVFTPGLTSQGGERRLAMRKGWWLAVNENRWAVSTTMAEAVAAVAAPANG